MADTFDKETRSKIMSRVKSKGNKSTEQRLINILCEYDIKGWRRNYPIKGHPDFIFLNYKIAIFVDGCFWHGHDCRNTRPKDNAEYWENKIGRNIKRDKEITNYLENRGWKVIRIWECEMKKGNEKILEKKLTLLTDMI